MEGSKRLIIFFIFFYMGNNPLYEQYEAQQKKIDTLKNNKNPIAKIAANKMQTQLNEQKKKNPAKIYSIPSDNVRIGVDVLKDKRRIFEPSNKSVNTNPSNLVNIAYGKK
jgi:hypothetical protein